MRPPVTSAKNSTPRKPFSQAPNSAWFIKSAQITSPEIRRSDVTRLWRGGWKINPHAFGVDNIAGLLLALRQILFSAWVSLNEQKWSTLGERRGPKDALFKQNRRHSHKNRISDAGMDAAGWGLPGSVGVCL